MTTSLPGDVLFARNADWTVYKSDRKQGSEHVRADAGLHATVSWQSAADECMATMIVQGSLCIAACEGGWGPKGGGGDVWHVGFLPWGVWV